ncbi:hypothetical protein TNCT6_27910 [Streptomyces sp. 6-11-2]|nr:hypothetical protein TNCT6_27910 [Streptomyces sp. 6-11-2]
MFSVRPTLSTARAYVSVCNKPGTTWAAYSLMDTARSECVMNARDQSGNLPIHVRPQLDQQVVRPECGVERAGQPQRRFRPRRALDLRDPGAHHMCPGAEFGLGQSGRLRSLRTREPNSAAMDVLESIPLAKALLPFLTR